jgi:hypothetical protein
MLTIKTKVSVKRTVKDSLNDAVDDLLSGKSSTSVVEDLDRIASLYTAAMMHFNNDSERDATLKAIELIGSEPDALLLHTAITNSGIPKKDNQEINLKEITKKSKQLVAIYNPKGL